MKKAYFDLALRLALTKGNERDYLLAALAIRSDGALVYSVNESARIPTPEAHAEFRVSGKCDRGSVVIVARVWHDGTPAMSRPCVSCQTRMRNRKVEKVYYSIGPNEWGLLYLQDQ